MTFPAEKVIVSRERAGKMYHVSAYYLSKVISEMPMRIFGNMLYAIILYWFVGLRAEARRFFTFFGIILMQAISTQALAFFTSALAKNTQMALAGTPMMLIILILFGGFFINLESLPPGSEWIAKVSNVRWAFQGMMIT